MLITIAQAIAIIHAALQLLPLKMATPSAICELLAMALQESDGLKTRFQYNGGPARGFWQFERTGGVRGIMQHGGVSAFTRALCIARNVQFEEFAIWTALAKDDVFAAGCARLLLWTDTHPMPQPVDDDPNVAKGWNVYIETWRPGAYWNGSKEKREALFKKWQDNWSKACKALA
jgi:hypothetical protein